MLDRCVKMRSPWFLRVRTGARRPRWPSRSSSSSAQLALRHRSLTSRRIECQWRTSTALCGFHAGDDLRWADPDFDDSSWSLLRAGRWGDQGYEHYSGVAWYRFRVILPREHSKFSILFGDVNGSYQAFSNGQLIGQMGKLPPHEQPFFDAGNVYSLPPEAGSAIAIAVRVWCWRQWAGGCGLINVPRVGESDILENLLRLDQRNFLWSNSASNYQSALQLMAGFAGLGLFLLRRKEREYLWFGLFEVCASVKIFVQSSAWTYSQPVKSHLVQSDIATLAASLFFLPFLFQICGLRLTRLFWAAAVWAAVDLGLLLSAMEEWIHLYQYWQSRPMMEVPYVLFALFLVFRGMRWGNPDARLILVPVGLDSIVRLLTRGTSILHSDWLESVSWLGSILWSVRGGR